MSREPTLSLHNTEAYWIGRFSAMASPCEILMENVSQDEARSLLKIAHDEAKRIEKKFSRYRNDSVIQQINQARGKAIVVDTETAALLDYAAQCYQISQGKFDITAGVLRRIWNFNGSEQIPSRFEVEQLLKCIGWPKARWQSPEIQLEEGMEIDFGGFGKEYAVDRTTALLRSASQASVLVNYGGDLAVTRPSALRACWTIGLENLVSATSIPKSSALIDLSLGALATSGDTRRFLLKDGVRYGHILDPTTGWPVPDAPQLVTVAANTCTEAGILATLAILQGANAHSFLSTQAVQFRCVYEQANGVSMAILIDS